MSFNPDPSKQVQKEISDRKDNETLHLPLDTKTENNMSQSHQPFERNSKSSVI